MAMKEEFGTLVESDNMIFITIVYKDHTIKLASQDDVYVGIIQDKEAYKKVHLPDFLLGSGILDYLDGQIESLKRFKDDKK
jgi:hypothetical protein